MSITLHCHTNISTNLHWVYVAHRILEHPPTYQAHLISTRNTPKNPPLCFKANANSDYFASTLVSQSGGNISVISQLNPVLLWAHTSILCLWTIVFGWVGWMQKPNITKDWLITIEFHWLRNSRWSLCCLCLDHHAVWREARFHLRFHNQMVKEREGMPPVTERYSSRGRILLYGPKTTASYALTLW